MLEVAVQIDAARTVFIEIPVTIRIAAFPVQRVGAGLPLSGIRFLDPSLVVLVQHIGAVRVHRSHEGDQAIAIQIFRAVLIDAAVVVVVVRECVAPAIIFDRRKHGFRRIRVQPWHDVEHLIVEIGLAGGQEVTHRFERELATDHMVALEVADHEQCGPLVERRTRCVCDLDQPDFAPFSRRPDRPHRRGVRAVCEGPKLIREVVKVQIGRRLGTSLRRQKARHNKE